MKPISTIWHVDSGEERSDTYRLLNRIHSMAGRMSQSDIKKEWYLHSTASYCDYAKTVWSNGIMKEEKEQLEIQLRNDIKELARLADKLGYDLVKREG